MTLSNDAIIFGLGHLRGPNSTLSFGGEGASMRITSRARQALDELLASGYAEARPADDQIPGKEYYRGTMLEPHLGLLAKEAGIDLFGSGHDWTTFEAIETAEQPAPAS